MKKVIREAVSEISEYSSDLSGEKIDSYDNGTISGRLCYRDEDETGNHRTLSIEIQMTPKELTVVLDFLIKKYHKNVSRHLAVYKSVKKVLALE